VARYSVNPALPPPALLAPRTRREALRLALGGGAALGGAALLAACGGGSSSTPAAATTGAAAGSPKRGGNLRVGMTGGTSADTLDADAPVTNMDTIRCIALYNGLVKLDLSGRNVVYDLAEEMTPSKDAKTWTVRLRPDVTFHNGKDLTADDVIYTILRVINPKSPMNEAAALSIVDTSQLKKLDSLTLQIVTNTPSAALPALISDWYNIGIVPVGYDPQKPVGTGPFKYQSFTPGQQSVFTRYENYFQPGAPYLDQLTIIDFEEDTAAFDAVQSGQIDVYASATLSLVSQVQSGGALKSIVSLPGQFTPFTMRVDQPPFNDVRVRQAFRLIVDRPALIEQSLSGYGAVGNDVFSQNDPVYDRALTRHQDIPQAKSLLRQAGQSDLSVELVTAPIAPGVVEAAEVFAQQASAAGVNVRLSKLTSTDFFGPNYLKWTFAQDYWGYNPYLSQVSQETLPNSEYNETHFDNPTYASLYQQANATLDAAQRAEICHEMELIDFDQGGLIIPSYNKQVDIVASNVQGIEPSGTGIPVGNASWESIWLSLSGRPETRHVRQHASARRHAAGRERRAHEYRHRPDRRGGTAPPAARRARRAHTGAGQHRGVCGHAGSPGRRGHRHPGQERDPRRCRRADPATAPEPTGVQPVLAVVLAHCPGKRGDIVRRPRAGIAAAVDAG
jgi:peptide/nickel transport system substrate-binding protein